MRPIMIETRRKRFCMQLGSILLAVFLATFAVAGESAPPPEQKTFNTPDAAVEALIAAAEQGNEKEVAAIFGPASEDLFVTADPVADDQRRERFLEAYGKKHQLVGEGDRVILTVGEKDFPLPIPLVKKDDRWFFDTAQGREEILNRRIGENELSAMEVCLAVVDAEREYAEKDHDGDGILEYARVFRSDPGKRNGLYWKTTEGEEASPLGALVAQAKSEGYGKKAAGDEPDPYHGYFYKILTEQGTHAAGGAYDYLVDGHMFGGFALVAYPADYGNTGVMTFLVNHDGVLYEKDLGSETAELAAAMKVYDPDDTWRMVSPEERNQLKLLEQ